MGRPFNRKAGPLSNRFTDHPLAVGESYGEHCAIAAGFGLRLIGAGLACLVHGLFPFAFIHSGSDMVQRLHGEMSARRGPQAGEQG